VITNLKRWSVPLIIGAALLGTVLPSTSAAREVRAVDTAKLSYVSAAGALVEEGTASGTLPGNMRASVEVGPTVSGTFTFYIHGGTIRGRGSAIPHGSGIYASFSGSLTVTGGTGVYTHAHGHANLYGTFDRATYALLIQTTGTLYY
jgi:hypothetical protein